MKIVFMGTPDFAVPSLKALVDAGFDVSLVVSQPDRAKGRGKKVIHTPVKEAALEYGIEVFQPDTINSDEGYEKLKSESPDLVVVVAYGQIISDRILSIPAKATINVHASLLPKYRGASPINAAILNGDKKTGVTIMEVQKQLDSGDMLSVAEIEIGDMDSVELGETLSVIGAEELTKVVSDFDNYYKNKRPQNHEEATFCGKITKSMGKIDWSKPADAISNMVRGLKPWPIAFTNNGDDVIKVHGATALAEESNKPNGTIIKVDKTGIYVSTGSGVLRLDEIQVQNKRKMKVYEFLAGNSIETDVVLGGDTND